MRLLTLTFAGLALSWPAFAATNGSLGPNSTGTADIAIQINAVAEPEIQITGLKDIVADVDSKAGLVRLGGVAACVYATMATNFSLEVSAPDLIGTATRISLPYDLMVSYGHNSTTAFPEKAFASGGGSTVINALPADTVVGCSGSGLGYSIEFDTLDPAVPQEVDEYIGTLTFVVTPE